jgi:dolichol-phosphate mannosyltransferase
VVLTRNFGQSNAIAAGLEHCQGETIVIMDSDLEDRPEDIPKLLDALTKNDEQMIIAQRSIRKDSFSRKMLSWGFFKVSHKITNIKHPENLGVFRAFKRTLYKQIIRNDQLHGTILSRFYSAKIPFRTIDLIKYKRFAGKSGYTFRKRFKLALDRLLPHLKNEKLRQNRDPYFVIKEIMEIKETK